MQAMHHFLALVCCCGGGVWNYPLFFSFSLFRIVGRFVSLLVLVPGTYGSLLKFLCCCIAFSSLNVKIVLCTSLKKHVLS
jgi:hypothetical protein